MKRFYKIAVFVLILIIALMSYKLLDRFGVFKGLGSLFGIGGVTEEETVIVIEEIRNISQLLAQKYYDEIYFDSGVIEGGFFERDKRYALIAEGYVKAGFDLSSMDESDIRIEGKTVVLKLPAPKLLSIVSNPSNQEIFIARGAISQEEQNYVNSIITEKLKENAVLAGILERSAEQGRTVLVKLLGLFGFENVRIEMEKPDSQLRGEVLVEKLYKDHYTAYDSVRTETVEMNIRFESVSGSIGRTILVERRSESPGRCIITVKGADGTPLCILEAAGGKMKYLKGSLDDQSVRTAAEFTLQFDFYKIIKNRQSYIFHYLRTINLGGPFDVVAAFPQDGKWRKYFINRKSGFIQFCECPVEYRGRKTVERIFFNDYRKIGNGPMIMPLRCEAFVDNSKILTCSIMAIQYDTAYQPR